MRRFRPVLGITLLLTAAAIWCVVALTQAVLVRSDYRYADVVANYEEHRLSDVRPLLPPFTKVEYVNDSPLDTGQFAPTGYLTQYFLAPALITIDNGPQTWVLIDGRPDEEPVLDPKRRLVLKHDAGNGVRLYCIEEP
jgi:hypothetical protein